MGPQALPRGQARRAAPAPFPLWRERLPGRTPRQGRSRRTARPADALLARALRLQRAAHARAGRRAYAGRRPAAARGSARHQARLGLLLDRPLPPAPGDRARRGTADLRPAARRRRPHGLHAPRPAGRRRALHEALLPQRPGSRALHPHPGTGDRARLARSARGGAGLGQGADGSGLRACRRQDHRGPGPRLHHRPGADAADLPHGAGPRARHPSARLPRHRPPCAPRRKAARGEGGECRVP